MPGAVAPCTLRVHRSVGSSRLPFSIFVSVASPLAGVHDKSTRAPAFFENAALLGMRHSSVPLLAYIHRQREPFQLFLLLGFV